jgi:hypothetical protein
MRKLMILLPTLLLCLSIGCGDAPPDPPPIRPVTFGVNGHPFSQSVYSDSTGINFGTQIKLVKDAGLKWYRFEVSAPSSSEIIRTPLRPIPPPPSPDVCDGKETTNPGTMDSLVYIANSCGIQLLPVLIPVVNRDADTLDGLYSKAYSGAFKMVSRYKASIHVWELSNEEDVYSIRKFGPQGPNGVYPAPVGDVASDYYPPALTISEAILRGLADGARAADPSSLRIINFGWIHCGFIQNLENDGVPYDIVGIHWYSNIDPQRDGGMGDIACAGHPFPCPSPPCPEHSLHCPPPPLLLNLPQRVETITNNKPIWLTENGYQANLTYPTSVNMELENSYIPSVMQNYVDLPSRYPIQVVLIYELLNESAFASSQMGIVLDAPASNGNTILVGLKPVYESIQKLLNSQSP